MAIHYNDPQFSGSLITMAEPSDVEGRYDYVKYAVADSRKG
jgi:hypothetical protein